MTTAGGTQLRDPINLRLALWRLTVYVDSMLVSTVNINSNRFSLGVKNEQADAGRYSRSCLARPNSQARTETGKTQFSLFS